MTKKRSSGFFTIIHTIFFKKIGDKLKPGSLKWLNDIYYSLSEKIFSKFDIFFNEYLNFYHEIIDREITAAKITNKDKILVIGCGAIPSTCILLARKTKSQITGIDIDKKAIKEAVKYVNKYNLFEYIKIKYGSGSEFPVEAFSVVFLLFGVKNINSIFSHLASNIDKDCRVVYRVPFNFKIDGCSSQDNLVKYFELINEVETYSFGKMKTIVLKKKK